ncbi:MAG TPA: hypothetical protein PKZ42_01745 [Syntrophales bacterium]|nr:hypothetical protein [Syntrophales bacterium]
MNANKIIKNLGSELNKEREEMEKRVIEHFLTRTIRRKPRWLPTIVWNWILNKVLYLN